MFFSICRFDFFRYIRNGIRYLGREGLNRDFCLDFCPRIWIVRVFPKVLFVLVQPVFRTQMS